MTGSAALTATGGGQLKVHATTSTGVCAYSCSVSPALTLGAATVADPFASLPSPTVGTTCDQTNYSTPGSGSATISPGVYCGGITVGGSFALTMNSGTYIMYGGGFNIGNSGTVTGSNVTVFLTGGTLGGHTYTSAGLSLSGASGTSLSAPTSGTYEGVLFFQDRLVTYTTGNSIVASAASTITGTFYCPTTSMVLSGAVSASKIALVVDSLKHQRQRDLQSGFDGAVHGPGEGEYRPDPMNRSASYCAGSIRLSEIWM